MCGFFGRSKPLPYVTFLIDENREFLLQKFVHTFIDSIKDLPKIL
jgi:hypothetical protein